MMQEREISQIITHTVSAPSPSQPTTADTSLVGRRSAAVVCGLVIPPAITPEGLIAG